MENNSKTHALRNIGFYMSKSFKFYKLKNDNLTPIIFVIILIINSVSFFIIRKYDMSIDLSNVTYDKFAAYMINLFQNSIISFITLIIINIFSTVYLAAYIKELKGESYTVKDSFELTFRNIFKIILVFIAIRIFIAVGLLFLIVPGIIVYLICYFNRCYIIDKSIGIIGSFRRSSILTNGRKLQMLANIIVFYILAYLMLLLLTTLFFSGNLMIQIFVVSFTTSIISLIEARLIALMYVDLEYGINDTRDEQRIEKI